MRENPREYVNVEGKPGSSAEEAVIELFCAFTASASRPTEDPERILSGRNLPVLEVSARLKLLLQRVCLLRILLSHRASETNT